MGIPNKTKKLISEEKIAKAVEMASGQTEPREPESQTDKTGTQITEKAVTEKQEKKTGRKPLAGDRPLRITFYLSENTERRFNTALLHEQMKLAARNIKTDKSLIIETALKEWMDKNGY